MHTVSNKNRILSQHSDNHAIYMQSFPANLAHVTRIDINPLTTHTRPGAPGATPHQHTQKHTRNLMESDVTPAREPRVSLVQNWLYIGGTAIHSETVSK